MNSPLQTTRTILVNSLEASTYTKITPPPVPRGATFPHITILVMNAEEIDSHDGVSRLLQAIVQVNCFSKSYNEAFQLRDAVKHVLLPFDDEVQGVIVQGVNHVADRELYNSETKVHQLVSRVLMWFEYTLEPIDYPYLVFLPDVPVDGLERPLSPSELLEILV